MSTLAALRSALVGTLTAAGVPAWAEVPERVAPPAVLLEPGDPWIEGGQVFGARVVRLDLFAVAGPGTNAGTLAQLEGLLEALLEIDLDPFTITTISTPYIAAVNGYEYLTARASALAHDQKITST